MGSKEFLNICKNEVAEYFNKNKDATDKTKDLTADVKHYRIIRLYSVRLFLMVCITKLHTTGTKMNFTLTHTRNGKM